MTWHLLASTYFDFEAIERDVQADRAPRHFLRELSRHLDGAIHHPVEPGTSDRPSVFDRFAALLYSDAQLWQLARRVRRELEPGDGVYATGANSGLPLALLCSLFGPRQVNFAIAVTDVQRPRVRLMGWLLVLLRSRWLILVPHDGMVEIAAKSFGRFAAGIMAINGLTDFEFFRPDPAEPAKRARPASQANHDIDLVHLEDDRPLLVSCGAEARDYGLLAAATNDLSVDVKVCFASPNLTSKTRYTMPNPLPDYMHVQYFSFPELRDLYQGADVVVVPLLPNRYAAGLTTVFEAVACGRPVVVARSPGVVQEMINRDLVSWYEMGDLNGLRTVIADVLADPASSQARADRAHRWVQTHYSSAAYRRRVFQALETAFGERPVAPTSRT